MEIYNQVKKILHTVFIAAPAELYIFWLAWFAGGWGILLATNADIFESAISYYVLRDISTNPLIWLLVYGGVSVFTFFCLMKKSQILLMVSCMLMVLLWSFTAVALFIPSGVVSTAQFVYGTFMLFAAWSYLRVGNYSYIKI